MKKLLILCSMLLSLPFCLIAEEAPNDAIVVQSTESIEDEKHYELYPKNHKTFFLSVANQITLMNKLLVSKGNDEVVRYFLSLKNHSETKALELLSAESSEDLRLVILENLPISTFAELIKTLFQPIGGEAVAHWGYKDEKKLEKTFMTSASRAQQYINFFMQYKTTKENKHFVLGKYFDTSEDDKDILKSRGEKIARVLNSLDNPDDNTVIDLLYGRGDTRFIDERARIEKSDKLWLQAWERKDRWADKDSWVNKHALGTSEFNEQTQQSRVSVQSINYIIPHLSPRLMVAVFAKEANGNQNALVTLVQSIGCDKAFNELFDYLEDNLKDKVFEFCSNDNTVLDILGLDTPSNNVAQLGDGSDKKDL